MDLKKEVERTEARTMAGLKDFQRATVERVAKLFREGQNRVLVADEVGLGKTLIARGAIAKMARIRLLQENDDFFRVAYVCANLSIANQNLEKLNIFHTKKENTADARLSMQHLNLTEQEISAKNENRYVELIPLTPETSFHMTYGGGSVRERSLMYAILKRMPELKEYQNVLERTMVFGAENAWNGWCKTFYEQRVQACHEKEAKYPDDVIERIREYDKEHGTIRQFLEYLSRRQQHMTQEIQTYEMIGRLRTMFAYISVGMLNADFVIMDEFQRFRFLLQQEEVQTETGMLAARFLHSRDTRVLLLSATPYKLYSTLEEIDEANADDHYSEFFDVMKFLFSDTKKITDFETVWTNYSVALHELKEGDTAILALKDQAENSMYNGVCRTEKISVMGSGDLIDDRSTRHYLKINESDIRSYLEAGQLLRNTGANYTIPVDYVKSCPFLMSFMRNYKVKARVEEYFDHHPSQISMADRNLLWLNKRKINHYEALPETNARLTMLKNIIFQNRSELFMWVPPSKPYYEMQGVYKNSKNFSKILVFSSWEMVPRMIGSLISYESERLTVGKLIGRAKNEDKRNCTYSAERRFPYPRLTFGESEGRLSGMPLFCFIFPSRTLAEIYNPISCMNRHMNLSQIEKEIGTSLDRELKKLISKYQASAEGRIDERWYYLAPMLLDREYALKWLEDIQNISDEEDTEDSGDGKGEKNYLKHLNRLKELLSAETDLKLGRIPDDLTQILTDMTLGSPAVCIFRANGNDSIRATELSKVFLRRFNSTEATAIIDLAYERRKDDSSHWQDVLRYCKDGNFQAMFDEYTHMLKGEAGFDSSEDANLEVHNKMEDALKFHAATYVVDTYPDFRERVEAAGNHRKSKSRRFGIRSQFAAGFIKGEGNEKKDTDRKDSVRNAFNSPLRPFVLATTSIGQEGLDFHYYCRKVMHWNLPGNPIDLEQREGRINRYKCLAIRQDIASKYGNIAFKHDVWEELFKKAAEDLKQEGQSDLVPYWCLGKHQDIKIERIVPMYPISKDEVNYERLIKILSLYRLTLGQTRQEELLEYMFTEFRDSEKLKQLFINLSPYSKENRRELVKEQYEKN